MYLQRIIFDEILNPFIFLYYICIRYCFAFAFLERLDQEKNRKNTNQWRSLKQTGKARHQTASLLIILYVAVREEVHHRLTQWVLTPDGANPCDASDLDSYSVKSLIFLTYIVYLAWNQWQSKGIPPHIVLPTPQPCLHSASHAHHVHMFTSLAAHWQAAGASSTHVGRLCPSCYHPGSVQLSAQCTTQLFCYFSELCSARAQSIEDRGYKCLSM